MSGSTLKALNLPPEILDGIAKNLIVFTDIDDYEPFDLHSCILVSKHWHQSFIPHLYSTYVEREPLSKDSEDSKNEEYWQYLSSKRRYSRYFLYYQSYGNTADNFIPFESTCPPTNLLQ